MPTFIGKIDIGTIRTSVRADNPSKAEVSNLNGVILPDENVGRSQVTMYVALFLEVGHSIGNLKHETPSGVQLNFLFS